jgi:hypothetical protein
VRIVLAHGKSACLGDLSSSVGLVPGAAWRQMDPYEVVVQRGSLAPRRGLDPFALVLVCAVGFLAGMVVSWLVLS